MKKSLTILSLVALFGASSLYAADNAPIASNDNAAVLSETTGTNVSLIFMGRIGGYEATMQIYNGKGTVYLQGSGERTLKVKSYNGRKLVINKSSYGNALVPFLVSSFEEIVVTDFRYCDVNLPELCRSVGATDLLFAFDAYFACTCSDALAAMRVQ